MDTRARVITALIACAVLLGSGVGAGYFLFKAPTTKPETYAPAIRQGDNSLVLERKHDADAKPSAELPKGSKLERKVSVSVKPTDKPVLKQDGSVECPPANVDLSLVRNADNSHRVVASSTNGVVLNGVDIPVEPIPMADTKRWALGAYADTDRERGLFVERDFGRLRTGVDIGQGSLGGVVVRARVGITF